MSGNRFAKTSIVASACLLGLALGRPAPAAEVGVGTDPRVWKARIQQQEVCAKFQGLLAGLKPSLDAQEKAIAQALAEYSAAPTNEGWVKLMRVTLDALNSLKKDMGALGMERQAIEENLAKILDDLKGERKTLESKPGNGELTSQLDAKLAEVDRGSEALRQKYRALRAEGKPIPEEDEEALYRQYRERRRVEREILRSRGVADAIAFDRQAVENAIRDTRGNARYFDDAFDFLEDTDLFIELHAGRFAAAIRHYELAKTTEGASKIANLASDLNKRGEAFSAVLGQASAALTAGMGPNFSRATAHATGGFRAWLEGKEADRKIVTTTEKQEKKEAVKP